MSGKWLWVVIGTIVVSLALLPGCGESEQTVSEIVSVTDLVVAYARNEVAADIRFKGRTIIVTGGRIETIGKDYWDHPYIDLFTGATTVECMFAETDVPELRRLQPWQMVRIRGRCDGCPFSDIELRECKLVW